MRRNTDKPLQAHTHVLNRAGLGVRSPMDRTAPGARALVARGPREGGPG